MIFSYKALILAVFPLATSVIGATLPLESRQTCTLTCGNVADSLPFIQSFSQSGSDHFYTTSTTENAQFAAKGYAPQGVAGRIFPTQEPGTVPFFRLFNAGWIDHTYTANQQLRSAEINITKPPYADDTIAGYVYLDGSCPGTIPLFWAFSTSITDSFFTTDLAEYDSAISSGVYNGQGIAAYIYPAA
ncbi:hypothetical protein JR316_0003168 [Psilocybe cubensis]|uniref:Uncharacterized protein n=2 Tax=Psilocybe cubensis TaxID=181762 RepID=A0ACB8H7N7_PSICU|nr:hypothetical protein JR316_0003168 [Psilocybe cubensis]KAH9483697.1 hypothetical protein JR316_0003168 [Psilocybe cubensis]